jgi:hypothetical protein
LDDRGAFAPGDFFETIAFLQFDESTIAELSGALKKDLADVAAGNLTRLADHNGAK